ncbi:MAG: sirohydrochlorin cobaltochelatase [Proteobacteria bacterium]|nr:sirohydrochlorin cobaltochelatase [Pseudomonadota bacterium]MBU1639144.1 sirohydrochlorin cobaltochelatase [Pseudomonadota bacterium]
MKIIQTSILTCILLLATLCQASQNHYGKESKAAIVIASFGTTEPEALTAILNIQNKVKEAFPDTPVALTFTSNIIRTIWQERAAEPGYAAAHPEIPSEVLQVKGILATMGLLQDQGYNALIVQPTHIAHAEQFIDLCAYVDGLAAIQTIKAKYRPFHALAVGRPVTGTHGVEHDYNKDIEILAQALAGDVERAAHNKAALVYMAHGNDHYSTGIFQQFQEVMRRMYPQVTTYVGGVEGYPGFETVLRDLKHDKVNKINLQPLMIVAGDHALNDMVGDGADSWKNQLTSQGITVIPVLQGLGSNDQVAAIFVEHIRDAAAASGVTLR